MVNDPEVRYIYSRSGNSKDRRKAKRASIFVRVASDPKVREYQLIGDTITLNAKDAKRRISVSYAYCGK